MYCLTLRSNVRMMLETTRSEKWRIARLRPERNCNRDVHAEQKMEDTEAIHEYPCEVKLQDRVLLAIFGIVISLLPLAK